ncbi:hypothetical protein AXG93_2528s2130 [Marchantia polymorpha subsp. ruderalis]|uniref:Uncharacterized protein n=1 Tax=Marchantia polymorpha subsp. ruderalis TaxID=1480154 RepID=A0A176WQP4_MARPO|nr:hypothetical protein AXG93_2528s2130 [Marchantia polymorpha subsp. ruderalis]
MSAQHIEAIQRRRKITFDKKHKKRTLRLGIMVMLQDARKLDFPGKFHEMWVEERSAVCRVFCVRAKEGERGRKESKVGLILHEVQGPNRAPAFLRQGEGSGAKGGGEERTAHG